MAKRTHVPEFGNWDGEENYTVYFDKARKNRGGKPINPNDPQENPDMFRDIPPSDPAPAPAPPSRARASPDRHSNPVPAKQAKDHRVSREDVEFKQFSESPARHENVGRRGANESANQQRHGGRGLSSGRPGAQSVGSEQSFERSPLHPHYQGRISARSNHGSPAWEGKNSYDSSHGTPGRSRDSRMKPSARLDESPDRGAAVPKFGGWNDNDPQSAENYTEIFNKLKDEKSGNVPNSPMRPSYNRRRPEENAKKCCFPWW